MNLFTIAFVVLVAAGLALQLWLAGRQTAHIRRHRGAVPAPFADRISLAQHQKAADYSIARLGLQRWGLLLSTVLLLGWTIGGGLDGSIALLARTGLDPLWQGVALVLGVVLVGALVELPLTLWRTFGVEARYGFNRTTPMQFVKDRVLGLALLLALVVPLLLAILWLMQHAGVAWWLWAWAVWMGFTLLLTWAFPTWIAPMFNRFRPLADNRLRERLERLLQRCGFRSSGMYVMDGSRRSAHGNAYFTGFGRNKRIVFYDTLLDGLDGDEVEAVLAHELGHYKRRHVTKRLIWSAFAALAGLALLGWLATQGWFFAGLGVDHAGPAAALALFMLVLPAVTVFLSPVTAYLSRRHEFEADDFAARQTDARYLISGLVKMYRDNASTLTPDPLYSAFYHSHPPAPVRVAHLATKIA